MAVSSAPRPPSCPIFPCPQPTRVPRAPWPPLPPYLACPAPPPQHGGDNIVQHDGLPPSRPALDLDVTVLPRLGLSTHKKIADNIYNKMQIDITQASVSVAAFILYDF